MSKPVIFEDLPKGWQQAIISVCDRFGTKISNGGIRSYFSFSHWIYPKDDPIHSMLYMAIKDAKERGII